MESPGFEPREAVQGASDIPLCHHAPNGVCIVTVSLKTNIFFSSAHSGVWKSLTNWFATKEVQVFEKIRSADIDRDGQVSLEGSTPGSQA